MVNNYGGIKVKQKEIRILIITLIIACMAIPVGLSGQEEVLPDTTADTTMVEDTVAAPVTPEGPQMGGFEAFARRIVGSGLVDLFLQGGFVMWPILILLIWALATIIWKIIALRYAKIPVHDFLEKLLPLVREGKFEEAIELCKSTRGPVASMLEAGLLKVDQGMEEVEKALENASILEMSFLEKGLIALSTTVNLAPMLGFLGTVIGMIQAFQAIEAAGEVEPTVVAGGISVALITTAAGLSVAIPTQLINNFFLSSIDGFAIDMQTGYEKLTEALVETKFNQK